jgi:hypothetical protein
VQVQPGTVEGFRRRDGPGGGADQFIGPVTEVAADVAGHGRERRPGRGEFLHVVPGPVPDLDVEAGLRDPPHPFGERQVEEDHLGAGGQPHQNHPLL